MEDTGTVAAVITGYTGVMLGTFLSFSAFFILFLVLDERFLSDAFDVRTR